MLNYLLITANKPSTRNAASEIYATLKEAGINSEVMELPIAGLILLQYPSIFHERAHLSLKNPSIPINYALRVIPLSLLVNSTIEEIKLAALQLAKDIKADETWKIEVNKRFTQLHKHKLIEAIVPLVTNQNVDLVNPQKTLNIEILGRITGLALHDKTSIVNYGQGQYNECNADNEPANNNRP